MYAVHLSHGLAVHSRPASFCGRKFIWPPNFISWSRVGLEGAASNEKVFLRKGKKVCVCGLYYSGSVLSVVRYSVLPAISLNGMLDCSIVEGSFNTRKFKDFIEGLLDHMQPYPAPNSVIVMDNCCIHKDPEIIAMVESRCVLLNMGDEERNERWLNCNNEVAVSPAGSAADAPSGRNELSTLAAHHDSMRDSPRQ